MIDQRQFDIFVGTELWEEIEILENEADLPVPDSRQFGFGIVPDLLAVQEIAPLICQIQAADDIHQG